MKQAIEPYTGDGTVLQRASAGALSGAIGSAIASPTDLIKVCGGFVGIGDFYENNLSYGWDDSSGSRFACWRCWHLMLQLLLQ